MMDYDSILDYVVNSLGIQLGAEQTAVEISEFVQDAYEEGLSTAIAVNDGYTYEATCGGNC